MVKNILQRAKQPRFYSTGMMLVKLQSIILVRNLCTPCIRKSKLSYVTGMYNTYVSPYFGKSWKLKLQQGTNPQDKRRDSTIEGGCPLAVRSSISTYTQSTHCPPLCIQHKPGAAHEDFGTLFPGTHGAGFERR